MVCTRLDVAILLGVGLLLATGGTVRAQSGAEAPTPVLTTRPGLADDGATRTFFGWVAVPVTAVVARGEGDWSVVAVDRRDDALFARFVPVEVVMPNGGTVRVKGLPEDAEIVAVGAHLLDDGQPLVRYVRLTGQSEPTEQTR